MPHLDELASSIADTNASALLHIGRHKTGTTTVQAALSGNVDYLWDCGHLYPRAGRKALAHHEIAEFFAALRRRQNPHLNTIQAMNSLLREMQRLDGRGLLLSSEKLSTADTAVLRRFFPQAKVLVYLREQVDYSVSIYCQAVQNHTESRTLAEFLKTNKVINYLAYLRRWVNSFGFDRVDIRVYDRAVLKNGDILEDFCLAAGLDRSGLVIDRPEANYSIGGSLLEFKRRINRLPVPETHLRQMTAKPIRYLIATEPRFRGRPKLHEALIDELVEPYERINDRVSNEYFDGRPMFPRPCVAAGGQTQDPTTDDFREIIERLDDNPDGARLVRFLRAYKPLLDARITEALPG